MNSNNLHIYLLTFIYSNILNIFDVDKFPHIARFTYVKRVFLCLKMKGGSAKN